MRLIKRIAGVLFHIAKFILGILLVLACTFGLTALTSLIQSALLLPDRFIFWVVHDSGIRVVFLFEIVFVILFFYFFYYRKKSGLQPPFFEKGVPFVKKHKGGTIAFLAAAVLLAFYYMVFNITVVESDEIINYSFFEPFGKQYRYTDIKSIDTGVYGAIIPFVRSKGQFYYIVELSDGSRFDVSNINGSRDERDVYDVMVEIDRDFVGAGIPKKTDGTYFHLLEQNLDSLYSNKIKSILENGY